MDEADRAEAREAGMAFGRFSRSVQRLLGMAPLGRARLAGHAAPGPAGRRPETIRAVRAQRRRAVEAAMGQAFADVPDAPRLDALRAALAARLEDADVLEWLDTETTATVAERICCSLGLGTYRDDPDAPDSG